MEYIGNMKLFPCLPLPFLALAATAAAQSPHLIHYHSQGPDSGLNATSAGDLDQDGYSDYIRNTDGTAVAYSGVDGSVIRTFNATADYTGTARVGTIVNIGDVTGDQIPDFAWSNTGFDTAWRTDAGLVEVVSGANGNILWQDLGPTSGSYWGYSLANVGDVNCDGKSDLLIGSGSIDSGVGQVVIYSGANGALLVDHSGADMSDLHFGHAAAGVGDVNLDGCDDYIIGAYRDAAAGPDAGMARVYSGSDHSMLFELLGTAADDWFGIDVDGGMDANGDGTPDFVVKASRGSIHGDNDAVYVYSGVDASLLWQLDFSGLLDTAGSPRFVGDVNGDGYDDLAICEGSWNEINIHSGLDGAVLYTLDDAASNMNGVPAPLGDVDGDGMDDFVLTGHDDDLHSFIKVYGSGLTDRTLDLQCTDPFVAGATAPSVCYGSVAGQTVHLIAGFAHGRSFNAALGTYDVAHAIPVDQDTTNANGTARFNLFILPRYAGLVVYMQAGDGLGNRSNVVYRVVQ